MKSLYAALLKLHRSYPMLAEFLGALFVSIFKTLFHFDGTNAVADTPPLEEVEA